MFNILSKHLLIIVLIFRQNFHLIKTATTDFEMERVCASGEFDKIDHKTGYRTIQHYADDDNIELSKAHSYYRDLFMEGKSSDRVTFIKTIILELIIIFLAIVAFINYIFFILVWPCHCGIFKRLSDNEMKKSQAHCKYCKFFFMLLLFLISLALCAFGIIFISSYKKSFNLSDCSLLRFTNHGLYGTGQDYAGISNLKESFLNTSYSLNKIDTFIERLFSKYDDIEQNYNNFNSRMDESNSLAENEKIYSPNPDTDKFVDLIKVNYQPIYGPKINEDTILGVLYKKMNDKIKPVYESLTNLKQDFNNLKTHKDDYISKLREYSEYFELMETMYETLNRNIGKVYNHYMDSGIKVICNLALSLYFIFGILILFIIIFMFVYLCKKESTIFVTKHVRVLIHVLWNFLFIFSICGLILSGYIATYRKYSYNLIPSFNYLISSDIIYSKSSKENLFLQYANNAQIFKGLELFNICYNSSQSTDIANILGIRDSILYHFDRIYKHYNILLKYVYNNNLNEDILTFINEKEDLIDTYLSNITKTTSYETHNEKDFSIYINELNKYTDYGDKDTYQINCVTNTRDRWVTNKDDCPTDYEYSFDGSKPKNCLVMSEWTLNMIKLRYGPACKTKSSERTSVKANKYLERLKGYYDENKKLIIDMKNGVNTLIGLHDSLINNINLELANDNSILLNFTLPYSMFTNEESIYNLFDCGILKDDLIDFYDLTRHKLSTNSIVHMAILLLTSIINIISIYLLIKILYIFNRTTLEEYMNNSAPEEVETKIIKNKDINLRKDDKKFLSINTKDKVKNKNKGKKANKDTSKNIDTIRGTKSKILAGLGKNKNEYESNPSSSGEKLRTSSEGTENKSSEYDGNESEESKNGKNKNDKKDQDTSHEESEIESGIRDDGSAMS